MSAVSSFAVLEALPYAGAILRARQDKERTTPVPLPRFRGAGLDAQTITAHEWIDAGPAETGKTFATLWRLDTLLRSTPRARAGLVRKVRADMNATVLQTWDRIVDLRGGVSRFGGEHVDFYAYPNGARVYVGGMDRPGKVLSGERDWIYVNQAEELDLEDWETLTTRVTGRGAVTQTPMLFGDCNPGPSTHWILDREKTAGMRLLHSRHEDNPTLFDDAGQLTDQGKRSIEVLDALTGVRKERLRFGRWVSAEGVVYDDFQRGVHLLDRFKVPGHWRRVLAIDFGFTNPFAAQLWAIDPDGRMYLEREIYRSRTLVEDHAAAIRQMVAGCLYTGVADSEDPQAIEALGRAGVHVSAVTKGPGSVLAGIQAVQVRMKAAGDGKPRLFAMKGALVERDETLAAARRPLCLVDELEVYRWGKDVSGRSNREEPAKENDHACDAMRYAVMHVDSGTDLAANPPAIVHSETYNEGWGAL